MEPTENTRTEAGQPAPDADPEKPTPGSTSKSRPKQKPKADAPVPDKQVGRWKDDGGAVTPGV